MPTDPVHTTAVQPTRGSSLDAAQKARLQKAVKDFESVFVGYMLKTMRSSVGKSDMFGDSFGGDLLDGMFDTEMARTMSSSGSLGLADMFYRKLTGESLPRNAAPVRFPASGTSASADVSGVRPSRGAVQPSDSLRERLQSYQSIIDSAAQENGLTPDLLKAVIATESGGHANARSIKDAKGLMQLIDSTATDMGVTNVWDPEQNVRGGAKYLKQMLDRFDGNLPLALASYNAGPGAVEKHNGIPPFRETKEYVNRVMNYLQAFQQQEGLSDED